MGEKVSCYLFQNHTENRVAGTQEPRRRLDEMEHSLCKKGFGFHSLLCRMGGFGAQPLVCVWIVEVKKGNREATDVPDTDTCGITCAATDHSPSSPGGCHFVFLPSVASFLHKPSAAVLFLQFLRKPGQAGCIS